MLNSLRRGLAALSLAVALGAAAPASAPIEQLDAALRELAPSGAEFTLATIPDAERGAFARARSDRIEIDPAALGLVDGRQSARALAALLISYYAMPHTSRFNTNPIKPGRVAAAAGAILLGTRVIDPIEDKSYGWEERQRQYAEIGWYPPEREEPDAGTIRASRMLAMLGTAGGCSGPLADVLTHAEKLGSRDARDLVRRVRRDLGSSIYPPDYRCAG